jgi:hypothetical protein
LKPLKRVKAIEPSYSAWKFQRLEFDRFKRRLPGARRWRTARRRGRLIRCLGQC